MHVHMGSVATSTSEIFGDCQDGADEAGLQRYEQARNLGREFVVKARFLLTPGDCCVNGRSPRTLLRRGDRKGAFPLLRMPQERLDGFFLPPAGGGAHQKECRQTALASASPRPVSCLNLKEARTGDIEIVADQLQVLLLACSLGV